MSFLKRIFSILICCIIASKAVADTIPVVQLKVKRLPDMIIPCAGHSMFAVGDEIVVFGGHKANFVPNDSAQYFKDGKWHLMKMAYNHDNGFAVKLNDGKIIIAGGHEKHLGIGQTFTVEIYNPETHEFRGFGCLDTKRALARAVALENGQVVIAGNWYHKDVIEVFDGKKTFSFLKEPAQQRATPYIFRTAKDDAIIISAYDTNGIQRPTIIADRLKGEPLHVPLFDKYKLQMLEFDVENMFVGDEKKNDYTYLIHLKDSLGHVALAKVYNGQFSLVPTEHEIPCVYQNDSLVYSAILADREKGMAYMIATDIKHHYYVVALEYTDAVKNGKPAKFTFYQTEQFPEVSVGGMQAMMLNGDILITGGIWDSNYEPTAAAVIIPMANRDVKDERAWSLLDVIFICLGAIICFALFCWILKKYRKRLTEKTRIGDSVETEGNIINEIHNTSDNTEQQDLLSERLMLFKRICNLIESEKLYLNPELKVLHVAELVGISQRSVTEAVKSNGFTSFSALINSYRIEHAKSLLMQNPELKVSYLCNQVGFSNETSFFRTFKKITGMTPLEWLNQQQA